MRIQEISQNNDRTNNDELLELNALRNLAGKVTGALSKVTPGKVSDALSGASAKLKASADTKYDEHTLYKAFQTWMARESSGNKPTWGDVVKFLNTMAKNKTDIHNVVADTAKDFNVAPRPGEKPPGEENDTQTATDSNNSDSEQKTAEPSKSEADKTKDAERQKSKSSISGLEKTAAIQKMLQEPEKDARAKLAAKIFGDSAKDYKDIVDEPEQKERFTKAKQKGLLKDKEGIQKLLDKDIIDIKKLDKDNLSFTIDDIANEDDPRKRERMAIDTFTLAGIPKKLKALIAKQDGPDVADIPADIRANKPENEEAKKEFITNWKKEQRQKIADEIKNAMTGDIKDKGDLVNIAKTNRAKQIYQDAKAMNSDVNRVKMAMQALQKRGVINPDLKFESFVKYITTKKVLFETVYKNKSMFDHFINFLNEAEDRGLNDLASRDDIRKFFAAFSRKMQQKRRDDIASDGSDSKKSDYFSSGGVDSGDDDSGDSSSGGNNSTGGNMGLGQRPQGSKGSKPETFLGKLKQGFKGHKTYDRSKEPMLGKSSQSGSGNGSGNTTSAEQAFKIAKSKLKMQDLQLSDLRKIAKGLSYHNEIKNNPQLNDDLAKVLWVMLGGHS